MFLPLRCHPNNMSQSLAQTPKVCPCEAASILIKLILRISHSQPHVAVIIHGNSFPQHKAWLAETAGPQGPWFLIDFLKMGPANIPLQASWHVYALVTLCSQTETCPTGPDTQPQDVIPVHWLYFPIDRQKPTCTIKLTHAQNAGYIRVKLCVFDPVKNWNHSPMSIWH